MPGKTEPGRSSMTRAIMDAGAAAQDTAQQPLVVVVDPTGATGDPANGYATLVQGYLGDICGIDAFGQAYWDTGSLKWIQSGSDTGWISLTLINSWTGTLQYRVIENRLYVNGNISGGASGTSAAALPTAAVPVADGGQIGVVASTGTAFIDIPGSGASAGDIEVTYTGISPTIHIAGVTLLID